MTGYALIRQDFKCARCGERLGDEDWAEVANADHWKILNIEPSTVIIHASCIRQGEEVA